AETPREAPTVIPPCWVRRVTSPRWASATLMSPARAVRLDLTAAGRRPRGPGPRRDRPRPVALRFPVGDRPDGP
ncbi:hypothetical protein, partial [Streptomyces sp. NPDC001675]